MAARAKSIKGKAKQMVRKTAKAISGKIGNGKPAKAVKKLPRAKASTRSTGASSASLDAKQAKVKALIFLLEREFPDAKCALHYNTPEQLLFATILSAQCTDERVNMVTPVLFAKYPSSKEMARAKPTDVEKIIYSTGFFKNKTKSLIGAAKAIQEKYAHGLPQTIAELIKLPGVGRKTANVLLGDAFDIQEGVVVDTHVKRLTNLLGLTHSQNPEKIEEELMQMVPREYWTKFSHWLILHGRRTCIARRPRCQQCVIQPHCDFGKHALEELE